MDIAFCVDRKYLMHACAAVESICDHHAEQPITVWMVIDESVSPADRDAVIDLFSGRAEVKFLEANESAFGTSTHPSAEYITEAMYLRIQLPDLLPLEVKRVLYLDADVLCTAGGLGTLFNLDLEGKVMGAARDATTRRLIDNGGVPNLSAMPDLNPQALYFNSGVLLIDTEAWRARDIRKRCEQYLRDSKARRFPDQDALNIACYEDWYRLNKRYNHLRSARLDTHLGNALTEAVIIHFNSTIKPWDPGFADGYRLSLYRSYRSRIEGAFAGSSVVLG